MRLKMLGRRNEPKVYHVNLLKLWLTREARLSMTFPMEPELGPHVSCGQDPLPVPGGKGLTLYSMNNSSS